MLQIEQMLSGHDVEKMYVCFDCDDLPYFFCHADDPSLFQLIKNEVSWVRIRGGSFKVLEGLEAHTAIKQMLHVFSEQIYELVPGKAFRAAPGQYQEEQKECASPVTTTE